jgi:hypothetical protein
VYQRPKSAFFSSESGFSSRGEAETCKQAKPKALFGRGAHNVFRVRLVKNFEKHELTVNFEDIFDSCQVRYIN